DIQRVCNQFLQLFMNALGHHASRKGNTNVMMHLRGYFKKTLTKVEQMELSQAIESYRNGYVPLVVPLTLLKHYLLKNNSDYLKQQTFWSPYPEQLGLR